MIYDYFYIIHFKIYDEIKFFRFHLIEMIKQPLLRRFIRFYELYYILVFMTFFIFWFL